MQSTKNEYLLKKNKNSYEMQSEEILAILKNADKQ